MPATVAGSAGDVGDLTTGVLVRTMQAEGGIKHEQAATSKTWRDVTKHVSMKGLKEDLADAGL
jgi:hypothetical protein